MTNNISEDEIISIEEIGEIETIDIAVSDDNLFFANNILTHNSAYGISDPGMEMTGESIGLSQTVDAQMSIWSEEGDEELGIIRMGMMKNRFGPNHGSIIMKINYETLKVFQEKEGEDVFATETEVSNLGGFLQNLK